MNNQDNPPKEDRVRLLNQLPQTGSFRFIDEIREVSENHIIASYRFRGDEWFYSGHFEGDPVTPGVILIESMAQAGLVALGLYLARDLEPALQFRTLFTECSVEFFEVVRPNTEIVIEGKLLYWRRRKLRSEVKAMTPDGKVVASGIMAGLGVGQG